MRVLGICLSAVGCFFLSAGGEEGCFFGCLTFWGFGHPSLAWLNCRRFLAGAVLLDRGCVLLGVRVSSAMLPWGWVRSLGVSLMTRSLNKAFA